LLHWLKFGQPPEKEAEERLAEVIEQRPPNVEAALAKAAENRAAGQAWLYADPDVVPSHVAAAQRRLSRLSPEARALASLRSRDGVAVDTARLVRGARDRML